MMEKGLPANFQKTNLTVGTLTFPVWQNSESEDFYLMYAMNELGEESFYQYDTKDETYQRYPIVEVKEKKTTSSGNWMDKIQKFLRDQVLMIVAAAWAVILVLIIVVIVLGTKLRKRNEELDDLYDAQEDAVSDSRGNRAVTAKKSRKQFVGYQDDEEFEEDDEKTMIMKSMRMMTRGG